MNVGRVTAIAGRIFTQFRRDRRTLLLILVVPIALMALVGYLLSENKEPLMVALVNEDRGRDTPAGRADFGAAIAGELGTDTTIRVRSYASAEDARAAVNSGHAAGAVVIGADFTERILSRRQASLRVVVRGIDPITDGTVKAALGRAMTLLGERLGGLMGAAPGAGMAVAVGTESLLGGVALSMMDYYAPAFIVAFPFFFAFLLTSVSFLRERSAGTIERLAASPATRLEVVFGYLLGFLIFALIQALVVMGYAVWVLHVRVAGSIGLVLFVLTLLVIGVVNLGIALSFLARNELQVVQFIPLVFTPQVLLSGLIWPVETLHPFLRGLAQFFPLTHAAAALRAVMVGGGGFADVRGQVYALVAFAVAMVGLGVGALHRYRA